MYLHKKILISTVPVEEIIDTNGLNKHVVNRTDTYQTWTQANEEKYQLKIACPPVGLKFLKQNIPSIDILEYPTWDEYKKALKNKYDIVGISFFTCSLHVVPKMIDLARQAGVKEIWAGNHGVLSPGVDKLFDRVFSGSGEKKLYKLITGKELKIVKHPVLISELRYRFFSSHVGYLYTNRGCNMGCSFCSTPVYLPLDEPIFYNEITKVLDIYKEKKVAFIVIYDETFFSNIKHSFKIAEAMAKRGLSWLCLTRADKIKNIIPQLSDLNMNGAIIGIESFREKNLKSIRKRQSIQDIETTIHIMNKYKMRTIGTYMICHPEDTSEEIKRDIERLSSLGLFLAQITVLTPFPGTPLWKKLENQINDPDWNHFDTYHLVWDHPYIPPKEARELLTHAQLKINNPKNYLKKF